MKKGIFYLLVLAAVLFTAGFLFPELLTDSPECNDNTYHLALAKSLNDQISRPANLLDPWIPYWECGYPVFHYYQNLPQIITVLVYWLFLGRLSFQFVMHLLIYLLLVGFPVVIYYSLRKIGLARSIAAFSALFSLGISGAWSYGWDYSSYVWQGFGLYAQLFGMVFLPLACARVAVSLKTGRGYGLAVFFLSLTILSHVLLGYIAFITCLFLLVRERERKNLFKKLRRLGAILFITAIVTSYFWLPLVLDSAFHYKSVYVRASKFDSFGHREILTKFINGELLDSGRFPIMTILCISGLLFSLYKIVDRKEPVFRFIFCGFVVWLFLYFGRPTWGGLMDLLPLSEGIHLERLVNGLHFFVLICVGAGVEFFWQAIRRIKVLSPVQKSLALLVLIGLISVPVFKERATYLLYSAKLAKTNRLEFNKEWPDFKKIIDKVKSLAPGRLYCGRKANWGYKYKLGSVRGYHLMSVNQLENLGYMPFGWPLLCDFQSNFNERRRADYELFNVRYVITDEERKWPKFVRPILQGGRHILYQVDTSGYFDLVNSNILLQARKHTSWNFNYLWLLSRLPERKQFMTISSAPLRGAEYSDYIIAKDKYRYTRQLEGHHIFDGTALFDESLYPRKKDPGRIDSETKADEIYQAKFTVFKDCFLLFKVNFHPNWHILVDEKEAEKIMLSPGMIGVCVSPGEHTVRAFYRPRALKPILLAAGLFSLIGFSIKGQDLI